MTIPYVPGFHPPTYIDNQSRVQAQGPDGFNTVFQNIEAEFAALQLAIQSIEAALAPPLLTSTFTPNLLTVGAAASWTHAVDGTTISTGPSVQGVMDVQLPDNSKITGVRVIGKKGAGTLAVQLMRGSIENESAAVAPEPMADANVGAAVTGFFTIPAVLREFVEVNANKFHNFITAKADGVPQDAPITLYGFSITCLKNP
jgi:hypothetical protein